MVKKDGVEPSLSAYQTDVITVIRLLDGTPCRNRTHIFGLGDRGPVQLDEGGMEASVGIEPTIGGLQSPALPLGYVAWYSRRESNPHAF